MDSSIINLIGHGQVSYRPCREITLPPMAWGNCITLTKGRDYHDIPAAYVCAQAMKGGDQ